MDAALPGFQWNPPDQQSGRYHQLCNGSCLLYTSGRLVPQIVYYVYAYAALVRQNKIEAGQEINIVVPTGNFGNILAAFYAKQMGLPVKMCIRDSHML